MNLCISDVKHVLSGLNPVFLSIYFPNHLSWARETDGQTAGIGELQEASEERHSTSSYLLHYDRSKIHPKTKESEYEIVGSVMQLWSDAITNVSFRKETQSPDREVRTANDSIDMHIHRTEERYMTKRKKEANDAGRKEGSQKRYQASSFNAFSRHTAATNKAGWLDGIHVLFSLTNVLKLN